MSKNNVVRKRETETGSDSERTETVDLGIGISVDLEVDPATVAADADGAIAAADDDDGVTAAGAGTDADDGVVLAFDERQVLEAGEDRPTDETATDDRSRLEPDERTALKAADIDPEAIPEKEYSYRMLLDAGLDETTAGTLRRRFSLPWSFESDGDLDRRSDEVRGLGAAEREWIAVSADEDWQAFEYDASPVAAVGREKPSERPWPKPTPVTAVTGVGPDDADELAEAGICSAERLATISAFDVARVLGLNVVHVRTWRHNARELLE
ncbi:hypothetical protein [Natronorubrum texcoconense]|uniref:Helix-hairpin-helix domain-containing protein n=1 Tax=Natronorubrum texcoconense TaxID=1095776 RepID=A0A1G8X7P3_9EURY|nr:hypothetical protein [Natronorubrum texcoconense]SDJ86533.1 hypothetical protein SAMN04515672_1647 [Natronorubrum texcoconense]